MIGRRIPAAVLALGLVGCRPPSREPLEGAWRVVHAQLVGSDGRTADLPLQENLVLFTGDHYSMAYVLGRVPFPPYAERWKPSPEEELARFAATIMNGGRYRVTGNQIVVRPLVAMAPEFVGGEGRFRFALLSDTLELTWDESIAFDGLRYPSRGTVTHLRLVRTR